MLDVIATCRQIEALINLARVSDLTLEIGIPAPMFLEVCYALNAIPGRRSPGAPLPTAEYKGAILVRELQRPEYHYRWHR